MIDQPPFLPMSSQELSLLEVDQLDIILISGDAYVDHPSFGAALIGRALWAGGYTVGIIAQPNWKTSEDFKILGSPRLFFGITSGNVDSMVNAFTPNLKRRHDDVYSPGGRTRRPDRAVSVYADIVHSRFPDVPAILGGIEASLRRFAHYDYWSDKVRGSILADAPAQMLVFGMGERPLLEVARRLDAGEKPGEIQDVPGTTVKMEVRRWKEEAAKDDGRRIVIPGYSEVSADKRKYAVAFRQHYLEQDPFVGRIVVQPHPKTVILQNPPSKPLSTDELDRIYELPYNRAAHPSYRETIPALEPVAFSITSHRGCFGACSFCALTHHQGRIVQSRSERSIIKEATALTKMSGFKGVIQDIGGPTANMYGMSCSHWATGDCPKRGSSRGDGIGRGSQCSTECSSIKIDHRRYQSLMKKVSEIPGVKHVFIGSGVRYDLLMKDEACGPHDGSMNDPLMQICERHVSGHLKVAPEHISPAVTSCMNKPSGQLFEAFRRRFESGSKGLQRKMYILPYFMSGHPGCTIEDMIELACYIRDHNLYTEQVQDFTPTPMTISTTMYHTGLDPFTMKAVHVPKGREKRIQRALLQWRDPKNRQLVKEGLLLAGRKDLIGGTKDSLI
jgi:uncharacterized radical SAM protein YgiQ